MTRKKNVIFYNFFGFTSIFLLIFSISIFFAYHDNSKNEIEFAQAGTSDDVNGFAWSSNIGWISFNSNDCNNNGTVYSNTPAGCPAGSPYVNYGVNIDNVTGNFSGYAWSSNVGWISFNRSDTGNPPTDDPGSGSGPIAKVDSVSGPPEQINGWGKILSLGDGGWVKFGDASGGGGTPSSFPLTFPFSSLFMSDSSGSSAHLFP